MCHVFYSVFTRDFQSSQVKTKSINQVKSTRDMSPTKLPVCPVTDTIG